MEKSSKKREVKRETRTNSQDEPARVYRPRTMALKSVNPETESSTSQPRNDENEESEKKRSFKSRERSDYNDRDTEKPRSRRYERNDSEKSFDKPRKYSRGSDNESRERTYAPRTGRIRKTDDDSDSRSFSERSNRSEHEERSGRRTFSDKPRRFDNDNEHPRKSRFSDKPKRFDDSDDRSGSRGRFGSRKNDEFGDRRESKGRFSDKPRRFEKSDNRRSQTDRYPSKPSRFEDSDNAQGYRSRTYKKKFEDFDETPIAPRRSEEKAEGRADGLVRLNKYIANSGLCSRREADEFIQNGQITVNGVVVTQLGTRVNPDDEIRFKGKELESERKIYILINKPKDYVTTVEDPHAKRTVMELIEGACDERVYPVGRLDRNSTGVLLLTNDGDLTKKLTHPSFNKKKVYHVGLDKKVSSEDMEKIMGGIDLDGEIVKVDSIDYTEDSDGSEIGVEIHTGQNRVVRRIFESLNYRVVKLDRVYFAGLTKKNLPRGKWRFLTQKEVNMLKMSRF